MDRIPKQKVKNHVYMLLEYAKFGCLYHLIDHKVGLPEDLALRYFRPIIVTPGSSSRR